MSNSSISCPYCRKAISSGYYLKHIFSSHSSSLFDPQTDKGKQNRFLIEAQKEAKPISFYLPNSQDNHCCLHCMVSCVKHSSALKHFEKEECKDGHWKKVKELCEQFQLPVSSTPGTEESQGSLETNPLFLAALYYFQKSNDALQSENRKLQHTLNRLLEKGIDIHEWDDEDVSDDEQEEDPTRNLDIVSRAMKWRITRTQCEEGYASVKPMLIGRLSAKRKAAPSNG